MGQFRSRRENWGGSADVGGVKDGILGKNCVRDLRECMEVVIENGKDVREVLERCPKGVELGLRARLANEWKNSWFTKKWAAS